MQVATSQVLQTYSSAHVGKLKVGITIVIVYVWFTFT